MTLQEGYIFISAPNSMTPSHVDPEHNFLLQIRGTKEMHVGRFDDTVEEQLQLERIYLGGHRNLSQEPDSAHCYALSPGDGVYVRPDAPHFVRNGPDPSVSFSITWRTPSTARASRVHRTNGRLRKAKLTPGAPRPLGRPRPRQGLRLLGRHGRRARGRQGQAPVSTLNSASSLGTGAHRWAGEEGECRLHAAGHRFAAELRNRVMSPPANMNRVGLGPEYGPDLTQFVPTGSRVTRLRGSPRVAS